MFEPMRGLMQDPEHEKIDHVQAELPLSPEDQARADLIKLIKEKGDQSSEVVRAVGQWLITEQQKRIGDKVETMADQVALQLEEARLFEEAWAFDRALRILSSLAEVTEVQDLFDLKKQVETAKVRITKEKDLKELLDRANLHQ